MSTIVQIKRSETASAIPTSGQLAIGELALNLTDKKLFSKKANGDIVSIGGVGVDGGSGTTSVGTIAFSDTAFSDFYVDTDTTPGTAIVRLNQITDLDYGLITDEVAAYNAVDYGSI
jgi:hypothetical protein